MNALRRWKWPVIAVVTAFVIAGVATWFGYRTYQPMRIVGPSMAETLLGKHGELECERCHFRFRFDLEDAPIPDRLICPNCGHVHTDGSAAKVFSGNLVRLTGKRWNRYAVVAFEIPGEQDKLGVKRIIGLPGELVSIKHGDIYIDGARLADSDERSWHSPPVHAMFHDIDHRWQPATAGGWRIVPYATAGQKVEFAAIPLEQSPGFHFDGDAAEGSPIQWVEYHHRSNHVVTSGAVGPVLDTDSYNQSLSRQLNEVCDLWLSVSAKFTGSFAIRLHDGWRDWVLEMDAKSSQFQLFQDGKLAAEGVLPDAATRDAEPSYDLSVRDGWLRLKIASQLLIEHQLPPANTARKGSPSPVAFGARNGKALVSPFNSIYRDIYYLDPVGLPRPWSMERPLGPDEYFLLGDNVPVSTDSRHFGPVRRDAIRGVVQRLDRRK